MKYRKIPRIYRKVPRITLSFEKRGIPTIWLQSIVNTILTRNPTDSLHFPYTTRYGGNKYFTHSGTGTEEVEINII